MKLFLHAGTEKTGSSHIQTLCANGRRQLRSAGLWFPYGIMRHEKRMRAGLVSAGNAFLLANYTRLENQGDALAELVRHRETAQSNQCAAVFLTSELLLPFCERGSTWRTLFQNCRKAGFTSVSVLVILRDPDSQLVSLYKHRARSGTAGRLEEWVESGYHLPEDLTRLREQARQTEVELIARGYSRKPGALERVFFHDWLDISPPPTVHEGEVNPSLSLSELELIRQVHQHRPALVPFIHERLMALRRECKVQTSALDDYARALAAGATWQNRSEWRRWNELLPKDEALNVPATAPDLPEWRDKLEFSPQQMEEFAACMADIARPGFLAHMFWRSYFRPRLGKIRRRLMNAT